MTDRQTLSTALSVALHDAQVCSRYLRQSDVDHDRLTAHSDQLLADALRLISHVMATASSTGSRIVQPEDGQIRHNDHGNPDELMNVLHSVYGYATFMHGYVHQDGREYETLAEYADGLHDELSRLMTLLSSMGTLPPPSRQQMGQVGSSSPDRRR